jgi:hypothetical protein
MQFWLNYFSWIGSKSHWSTKANNKKWASFVYRLSDTLGDVAVMLLLLRWLTMRHSYLSLSVASSISLSWLVVWCPTLFSVPTSQSWKSKWKVNQSDKTREQDTVKSSDNPTEKDTFNIDRYDDYQEGDEIADNCLFKVWSRWSSSSNCWMIVLINM